MGDNTRDHVVPPALLALLRDELGSGRRPVDAAIAHVVAGLAPSRLADLTGASADGEDRVRHARGQGFPDLVAIRSGLLGAALDAVVRPRSAREVRDVLARAADRRPSRCRPPLSTAGGAERFTSSALAAWPPSRAASDPAGSAGSRCTGSRSEFSKGYKLPPRR